MPNAAPTPAYSGVAINHAEENENRIHSDDVAARLGFTGALVPGVTVFGLTSIALTNLHNGGQWLTGNTVHTRFLKPAYNNDPLDVFLVSSNSQHTAQCKNKDDVLLCSLQVNTGVATPEFVSQNFDLTSKPVPVDRSARKEISWDTINEDHPFPTRAWTPTSSENTRYATEVADTHPDFTQEGAALVHPHYLLAQANTVLVDKYEMPAWIHVGSEVRLHEPLTTDREYLVYAKPLTKWKKKGHEFVTVYIAYTHSGEPITEIWHTAIFRIAGV